VVTARSRGEALPAGAAFVAGDVASASGVKALAAGALGALGGKVRRVGDANADRDRLAGNGSSGTLTSIERLLQV
jgi:hypothetical protein